MSAEKKFFDASYRVMREYFGAFFEPIDYWPAREGFISERIDFKNPDGPVYAVLARMTFWLSEKLLEEIAENDEDVSVFGYCEDLSETVNDDSPLMKSWKSCYTKGIHAKFLRLPDGNIRAHMFIVSVFAFCDNIRRYFEDDHKLGNTPLYL
jgi:hypothetical protein